MEKIDRHIENEDSRIVKIFLIKLKCILIFSFLCIAILEFIYIIVKEMTNNENLINFLKTMAFNNTNFTPR